MRNQLSLFCFSAPLRTHVQSDAPAMWVVRARGRASGMSAEERAADISYRIRRNLGTFSVPKYNHIGDPHDKYGDAKPANRFVMTRRDGISHAQPTELWKQVIDREHRYNPPAAAPPPPPPLPAPAATPTAAASAPTAPMPPGWYYVPSLTPDGQMALALTYVPFYFAAPAS